MTVRLYVGPAYGIADADDLRARIEAWRSEPSSPPPRAARIGEYLRTGAGQLVWVGDDDVVLPLAWLADESAISIAKVIGDAYRHAAGLPRRAPLDHVAVEAWVTNLSGEDFAALTAAGALEHAPTGAARLVVGSKVKVRTHAEVPRSADLDECTILKIAAQHLPRGMTVTDVELDIINTTHDFVTVEATLSPRSKLTLGQVIHSGEGVSALLQVAELDAARAWALVQSGRGDLLLGQQESDWLEVKSAAYRLDEPAQVIEAAQDVARLANGGTAGLLLCGYKTKRLPGGGEMITALSPIPDDRAQVVRLRRALDRTIYPPIPGLRISYLPIARSAAGVLAVFVPRQMPRLRPFLVHGAVAAGRVEGAFISIVTRRDDESLSITAPQIHALLAGALAQDPAEHADRTEDAGLRMNHPDARLTPRFHPSRFADPLQFQPDMPGLNLRAATSFDLPAGSELLIEPRHRKRLLSALDACGGNAWMQPSGAWQSTSHAVFAREVNNGFERLTITRETGVNAIIVIADHVAGQVGQMASMAFVIDQLAELIRRSASDLRAPLHTISSGGRHRVVEVHIEARGKTPLGSSRTVSEFADLAPLGEGRTRGMTDGATAWPSSWATAGAERALALEAFRRTALDWGYLDPDPAFAALGWSQG
ncbi:hypothetical protein E0H73_22035 [Kribbella pittospori]|uniref:Uncharacterized protein n=1 Tax=Kribbella pittospori TaxID=722689 RepID=A0A4R0KMT9_9ACTN|nr:hypothetical protein [Kribbella pittospori]TCC60604.1 hypothetical protein E0H73_22035 [Kribbella pittospori]